MPGILKVGMTERTPEARLNEANASDTWRPPTPYKIEFAKKASNMKHKERALHALLEQYTDRVHPRREFFRVSPEDVRKFFDLMDGEMWSETRVEEEAKDDEEETTSESATHVRLSGHKGTRDMAKCFTNGQRIRHTIDSARIWIGIYDSSKNGIVYDEKTFTLNKFAVAHYESEKVDRLPTANAWKECECEVDGKWISTYALPVYGA